MAGALELISRTTLASPAASITFSSIPATWTDLRIVFVGSGTALLPKVTFNSDTGSNYSRTYFYGNGTSANTNQTQNVTYIDPTDGGSLNASIPGMITVDVMSYAGSTYKAGLITSSLDFNGSGTVGRTVFLWRSTSAINAIGLTAYQNTFAAGTTATLYGIKG